MSSTIEEVTAPSAEEATGVLISRIFEAGLAFMELLTIYTGDRLGLYRELADRGPATPSQLAARADINERYTREWLEQQAAAGLLEVDDPAKPAGDRNYSISAPHAAVLADRESPVYLAYFGGFAPGMAAQAPAVVEAFRTGGGVPWSAFGPGIVEGQGFFNRSWLLGALGSEYLPSIPDVHARLLADPPARVLDAACGVGWAGIAIAQAYPTVTVLGVDPDASSIELARRNAEEHGVADRVRFEVKDAAGIEASGPFDLAIVVEAIHDMSRPVVVLDAIRRSLVPGGTLIVTDENVGETFTAPAGMGDRFCYASSVTLCLPNSMAEQPSAAVGAVMRPDVFRALAQRAGFRDVQILDHIELESQRFYRLDA
jgi:2-polyprenyl-3-methyl-5-hydroxy-6-metoxy-1,4-benzoquinol methylase